jgi:hypothetical protein
MLEIESIQCGNFELGMKNSCKKRARSIIMSSRATGGREGSPYEVSRVENDALRNTVALIGNKRCQVEIPRSPKNGSLGMTLMETGE